MTSTNPPSYYFSSMDYNSSFFTNTKSSSGLTIAQANGLYLNKLTPDTTNVGQTFNGGITASNVNVTSTLTTNNLVTGTSSLVNAWNQPNAGTHYLFNSAGTQAVNIGSSSVTGSVSLCPTITTRNAGVNQTLWNNCTTSANYFVNGMTSGQFNMATGSSYTGNINIGNTATTGRINLNGRVSFGQNFKTQNVLLGTNTFATNYQNTGLGPRFVSISVNAGTANEIFQVLCDSTATPTTVIVNLQLSSWQGTIFFMVLPNYYYRLTRNSTGTIASWTEWN